MTLQHLRASTANKRPTPAAMADGQLAMNTNLASPGLFFKDTNGDLVKAGPVHVGTTAPNASPASGGQAGNSKGELWLDTTGTDYTLKTWDGSAWREIVVTSTMIKDGTIVNADINASAGIVDTKLATIATAGKVSNSATTATSANTNSAIVARDGSGNFSAGTITATLSGSATALNTSNTYQVGAVGVGTAAGTGTVLDVAGRYAQTVVAVGALDINCSLGNYFTKTINANSTFTVSNVPASRSYSFTLELTHTSGTVTWFSGVEFPSGVTPTLTTGKTHLFMFVTDDGGTRWRAAALTNYTN
jgi:hypothetical protein